MPAAVARGLCRLIDSQSLLTALTHLVMAQFAQIRIALGQINRLSAVLKTTTAL